MSSTPDALPSLPLPDSITTRYVDCVSSYGLIFHTLQAGDSSQPLILFLHGFPELAYSWRRTMPAIAEAGFFCVAPDQRGYGRTTGWDKADYDHTDLSRYTMTNLVRDLICLVYRLGHKQVHAVVGHDFGAVVSANAALFRPDMFLSTVQMSHPHHAPPSPPFGSEATDSIEMDVELAKLNPPRKHYKEHNSSPAAASEWQAPEQGLMRYLRGYFHLKSADWKAQKPHPLKSWSAQELALMPEYYIMRRERSMPRTVALNMEGEDERRTEQWLPPSELEIYTHEWTRTGFQGALNWYRAETSRSSSIAMDMLLFAGRKLQVPCCFISGKQDWGNYQQPNALQSYDHDSVVQKGCFRGASLIENAGHWVQQEQPNAVVENVLGFLRTLQDETSN